MRLIVATLLAAIGGAVGFGTACFGQSQPLLSLETGGHMALIRSVIFTPDGRQLISAADDKVIRIWDVSTGKMIRTLRGETADGGAGKIYTLAISPDGRWLAAGGRMRDDQGDHPIRLYDLRTGEIAALFQGHTDAVLAVAFSPDGKLLASGSTDKRAIIWDLQTRKKLYELVGHKADINRIAFTKGGERIATASDDHRVFIWRVTDGTLLARSKEFHGSVFGLAASPVASEIAISTQEGDIAVLDDSSARVVRSSSYKGSAFMSLSFAPDGRTLLTGAGATPYYCVVLDAEHLQARFIYRGHQHLVIATAISPDGRLAVTAGGSDNEIHLWGLTAGVLVRNLRGTGSWVLSVGFSGDGKELGFGQTSEYRSVDNRGPLEIVLPLAHAEGQPIIPYPDSRHAENFRRSLLQVSGLSLNRRLGGSLGYLANLDILRRGKTIATIRRDDKTEFVHNAYTFTPDGKTVIAGAGNGILTSHSVDGTLLGRFYGHVGDIWAVATSPDGRILASGSDDQTLRLWNIATRELIVSLFYGKDGDWVMWTPQGYFASSPGGDSLVGWQINHGPEHAAEYVTAGQLRRKLNRPDIVERAIALASAEQAVKEAQGATFKVADLFQQPVPRLRIVPFPPGFIAQGGVVGVELQLAEAADPAKSLRVQVNGRNIDEIAPEEGAGFKPGSITLQVPLAKGDNTVAITALNETGEFTDTIVVPHEGDGLLDKRGTLYILAVGVDKYPGIPGNDLNFAGADARSFAEAMEKRAGPLHEQIEKRVLVNGANDNDTPTAANILDALDILRKAKETDTVMLFVAGHGINDGLNYRFVPTDAVLTADGTLRSSTVVPWHAFQDAIETAKGTRILFLDTCHSANAYNPRLLNESVHANILVYTSARWDQLANETNEFGEGHGLFTMALVEGVQGRARGENGEVRSDTLRDYIRERVKSLVSQLNKRDQEPQFYRGRDAENYLLARVK